MLDEPLVIGRVDSRERLGRVGVPTLIAVGSDDQMTPREMTDDIVAAIPGARLQVIPDCGHLPPLEKPAETAALLREWLDW